MATISNNADKVKKTIEKAIKKELSLAQLRERIVEGEVNRHNIIQLLHEYNILYCKEPSGTVCANLSARRY